MKSKLITGLCIFAAFASLTSSLLGEGCPTCSSWEHYTGYGYTYYYNPPKWMCNEPYNNPTKCLYEEFFATTYQTLTYSDRVGNPVVKGPYEKQYHPCYSDDIPCEW